MSIVQAQTIDVHAHVVLEQTMGAAGALGPELTHDEPPRFRVGDYVLHGVRYRGVRSWTRSCGSLQWIEWASISRC